MTNEQHESESYFDDSEEGAFSYEFEEVPKERRLSKGKKAFIIMLGFVVLAFLVVALSIDASNANQEYGEAVAPEIRKEWCVKHTESLPELNKCLRDSEYQKTSEDSSK